MQAGAGGGTMSQETYSERKARQIENARVGYQVAINLTNHEEQQIWSRSGTMLVANSILVVAISRAMTSSQEVAQWIPILMAPLGIFLCFLWICIVERTHSKCDYWVKSAGELERDYLCGPVVTLTRGKRLSDYGWVRMQTEQETETIEMSWVGKVFQIKMIPRLMGGAFIVLYLFLSVVCIRFCSSWFGRGVGITLLIGGGMIPPTFLFWWVDEKRWRIARKTDKNLAKQWLNSRREELKGYKKGYKKQYKKIEKLKQLIKEVRIESEQLDIGGKAFIDLINALKRELSNLEAVNSDRQPFWRRWFRRR